MVSHELLPGGSRGNFSMILRQNNLFSLTCPSQVAPHELCTTPYTEAALLTADRSPQEGSAPPNLHHRPPPPRGAQTRVGSRGRPVTGYPLPGTRYPVKPVNCPCSPPPATLNMAPRRTQHGAGGVTASRALKMAPGAAEGRWRRRRRTRGAPRVTRRGVTCRACAARGDGAGRPRPFVGGG